MIKTKDKLALALTDILEDASEHPLDSLEEAIDKVMEYINREDITDRMRVLVECVHLYGTYKHEYL